KRSTSKMLELSEALFTGMARHGITGEDAEAIHRKLLAFANYGFPESHAYSFAYLVYASSYLKCHYPAAFTAALLRSQPMGFYSPQSLVADARRHGVLTRSPDVLRSGARTDLEVDAEHHGYRVDPPRGQVQGERASRGPAIRLGLDQVRSISRETAEEIIAERERGGAFTTAADLARRVQLTARQLEALATAGALDSLAPSRRPALCGGGGRPGVPGDPAGAGGGLTRPDVARDERCRAGVGRCLGHRHHPRGAPDGAAARAARQRGGAADPRRPRGRGLHPDPGGRGDH